MKVLQKFSLDYLDDCKKMSTDEIINYLESFRELAGAKPKVSKKAKLISMRVPQDLLAAFKLSARRQSKPYQTLIKELMSQHLHRSLDQ